MNLTLGDQFIYIKSNQKKNNSERSSIYLRRYKKENSLEAYPIKPSKNIIPKDINLPKIFKILKSSTNSINKESSIYNINNRKKILYKIKEFIYKHNIENKIYFKAIVLFDILLIKNKSFKILSNEELALGALILSVKFNYIENKMISMKKYLDVYDDKIYTLQRLLNIERICLKMVNYYLNYKTPICFLEFFLLNGFIFNIDSLSKENYIKIYCKLQNVLENIMEESNKYLNYNFFNLACSIVSYTRYFFDLEKWPSPLKKIFGIDYINFEKDYNSLFDDKYIDNSKIKEDLITESNEIIKLNIEDNNSGIGLEKLNNSKFNIYKKSRNYINRYYNNIINININNYGTNNNIINRNLDTKINYFNKFNTNITGKNNEIKKIAIFNKINNMFEELEKENNNAPNEIINKEINTTVKNNKNYNFSSRFKININNKTITNDKIKVDELKNDINEYNKQIKNSKINIETPKKSSLNKSFQNIKTITTIKSKVKNRFESFNKEKLSNKIYQISDKEKKEIKARNKIKYNNLIKYKLSISSNAYKNKEYI